MLSRTVDFHYKATDHYAPAHERAARRDDPDIGAEWPTEGLKAHTSRQVAAAEAEARLVDQE